jgi:hypothetical protein
MLEGAPSSTLFLGEKWGGLWKEYFLQILVFMLDKGSFGSKQDY